MEVRVCLIDGCFSKVHCKGLCGMHYHRKRKWGTTDKRPGTRAANGEGHIDRMGYRRINLGGSNVLEHRQIMSNVLGRPLHKDETVHHKNGDRLDNRVENLELWSSRQPKGQRVEDKINYALEILKQYKPGLLK